MFPCVAGLVAVLVWLLDTAIAGKKNCAKPKVAARGHKAESPARFDTTFVWDEGHQPRDSFRPDGKYLCPCSDYADKHFSNLCCASVRRIQASGSPWPLPTPAGIH